jgi:hypothetical protein
VEEGLRETARLEEGGDQYNWAERAFEGMVWGNIVALKEVVPK